MTDSRISEINRRLTVEGFTDELCEEWVAVSSRAEPDAPYNGKNKTQVRVCPNGAPYHYHYKTRHNPNSLVDQYEFNDIIRFERLRKVNRSKTNGEFWSTKFNTLIYMSIDSLTEAIPKMTMGFLRGRFAVTVRRGNVDIKFLEIR